MSRASLKHAPSTEESGGVLPDHVQMVLRDRLEGNPQPVAFALADISPAGRFGQTWVIVLEDQLAVVQSDGQQEADVRNTPLGPDVDLEIVEGVGASRFRVVCDKRLVEELRFSGRQAKRFTRLLHIAQGQGERSQLSPNVEQSAATVDEKICSKCGRFIPDWADTCPRCLHKRKILWRLMSFAMPYKGWFILGVGSAIMVTLLQLVPPKLTKHLINDVLTPSKDELLWPLVGVLGCVVLLRVLFSYLQMNRLARLSELMVSDLRETAFSHLQKLSLGYFSKKPTGHLISRVTHDTDRLWDFITFGVIEAAMSLLIVTCIAVILFLEEPVLAALTLTPIPIALVLTYYHTRSMRRMFHRLWNKWSKLTSVLSDVIPGQRVVKAFTQEERETERFNRHNRSFTDDALGLHMEWTAYWPKIMLLMNAGTLIIWAYAAPRILNKTFDLGTFVQFLGYMWMFYGPIEQLGMMNRMFQRAATSAQRVFEVLDTAPTIYSNAGSVRKARLDGDVRFENVSFSYDEVKVVLKDVSFHVKPGEMIGLAGPSGSGKTTMVNLICRFYDVLDGRILVDGIDVRDIDLHELRSQIGVVLQEPYLFRGTVAENIGYGCPNASLDRVIDAAKAASAHDFIVGLPDAYDTMVGERGHTLSGGERQRVSIARAILKNPRILILDEATSSVDTNSEMKIQEAINRMVQGRTTFAIAHRLSTLRRADRLLILDKGKLIEQGTHEELVERDGLYAELHQKQNQLQALVAV